MKDQIETVALAIRQAMLDPDDDEAEHLAKAAIAAMLPVPTEPVAWMYEREADVVLLQERLRGRVLRSFTGWTETPLYALPTPPAGGSDGAEN